MKNLLKLLIFGISIIATSCQKDLLFEQPHHQPSFAQYSEKSDGEIEGMVMKFRNQCIDGRKHLYPKSSEKMYIPESVRLIEANLNYIYGFSKLYYEKVYTDTITISMTCANRDSVEMSSIINTFNSIEDHLTEFYNAVPGTDKHVISVDIVEEDYNNLCQRISAISKVGIAVIIVPTNFNLFTIGDDWYYGEDLGKCDLTSMGIDAADVFSNNSSEFHILDPLYLPCPTCHPYYTNNETVSIPTKKYLAPGPYPNYIDNTRDYLLFNQDKIFTNNYNQCIQYEDMNFYFNALSLICYGDGYAKSLTTPPNKSYINAKVFDHWVYPGDLSHTADIEFGILHFSTEASFPLDPGNNGK